MNESRELARFVSELRYEDLPKEVIAKTKDLVLDQLGSILACATLPWSKVIFRYVSGWGEFAKESTVAHYGYKTRAENAAFANACFGHGFEIDDIYFPGQAHPGCITVPTALAIGERESIDGRAFIVAIVAGYEVMGRINKAVAPSCHLRGFHAPTSITGPFAAAAVAGKILGFDSAMMLHALAIAGSHASGTIEYDQSGGSVKRMHAGMAVHGGIRSALLAQEGLTGPPTILEGRHGFCQAFADEYNLAEITDNLGRDFRVVMGTGFKAYCSAGAMHAGIDALRQLIAEHGFTAADVDEIAMGTNRQSISHIAAVPTDITSSQFSAPFGLALTLIRGSNGFNDYTEETLRDPEILNIASKVRMVLDPEVDSEFPATRAARITVKLKGGASVQAKVDYCKGNPQNPMTRQEFEDKFRGLASVVADRRRTENILATVRNLDSLKDMTPLISLLR
jgi:2-methylcitrate dehydratase PrpD